MGDAQTAAIALAAIGAGGVLIAAAAALLGRLRGSKCCSGSCDFSPALAPAAEAAGAAGHTAV